MQAKYYIGTSGWVYPHWREVFYPPKLAQSKWLEFYTRHFPTVELNNSFYHLPSEKAFENWRDTSPDDFVYAVKVSRFITHIKRLKNVEEPIETFLLRARHLQEKLGPLLFQLPPNMHRNDERLDAFLSLLPRGLRHVVEFRHESWLDEGVFEILRRHSVGFCVFDMPGLACPLVATADFGYIRFHGSTGLYWSCYSDDELEDWARRISGLARDLDTVYIYFNNDAEGFAVQNARTLSQRLA
ncbi:MAG: DUF72 domain-containing protein [Dehalococcoidia bacterium]|nr:MAG: DUF72 domain-containing protein [Dehalococcoidia bacterium]